MIGVTLNDCNEFKLDKTRVNGCKDCCVLFISSSNTEPVAQVQWQLEN